MKLSTLLRWLLATLGGALGWWLGALGGTFLAFVVSMVGTGLGLFLGYRINQHYLL